MDGCAVVCAQLCVNIVFMGLQTCIHVFTTYICTYLLFDFGMCVCIIVTYIVDSNSLDRQSLLKKVLMVCYCSLKVYICTVYVHTYHFSIGI